MGPTTTTTATTATADSASSRRTFLGRAALSGIVFAIGSAVVPLERLVSPALAQAALDDTGLAVFLQSVELAAVHMYETLTTDGKVTKPDYISSATEFSEHHNEHAAQFGQIAGGKATNQPNAKFQQTILDELSAARDEAAAMNVAYQVET